MSAAAAGDGVERKRGRRPAEQTKVRTRLAAWRVRRGLTLEELARAAGISRSTLIRLERAPGQARLDDLAQLALALGCEVIDLIDPPTLRWRNRDVALEQVHDSWRDETATPPPAPPGPREVGAEIKRLLVELPAEFGTKRRLPMEQAEPRHLELLARNADLAAIIERDPARAQALRDEAARLARLLELRRIVPPPKPRR